ncbi:heme-binding domain-containing protein [Arsenicibacter rosenii]|uniref:Cytochrome C n=1 Tax=Arsenicibacter rosenii TaxID=1750698 RepID=A0A1S2VBN1_9BACT|nr:heme-binding domain-containing protein [Arsenicibacter rosenii]OIN56089.1 cytochrome C [Arsenicibacter rosenii]
MKKRMLMAAIFLLAGIQFIRPARNLGNADGPQDITHAVAVPAPVLTMLKTSCYDCHANKTAYPWYANIQPVGLWLGHHVEEGKEELNFTEFATYAPKRMAHKLEEIAEEVEEGHMPLPAYTLIHADAKLTEAQMAELTAWAKAQQQQVAAKIGQ